MPHASPTSKPPEPPKARFTIFPKDATAKDIYEHLMKWSEEDGKARDDVSDETTKRNET